MRIRTKQAAVNVERDQSCVKDEGRKSSYLKLLTRAGETATRRDKRARRVRHAENVTGRKSNKKSKKSSNRVGDMREMPVRLKILQENEEKR
jgi:hypothetical protein